MINQNIPPVGFYFKLTFNGEEYAFIEVSGISMEMETDEIVEGGENRFTHRVPISSSFSNLVLKRGIVSQNSELLRWCQNTLEGTLSNPITTNNVFVHLLDANANILRSWKFHNAYPVKYAVGPFQSETNEVAIETLELKYIYFDRAIHSSNSNP
jgi:phage tail-like protein